jgi:hypothetical protein
VASAVIGIVLGASGAPGQGALGQDSVPMTTDQGVAQFSAEQLDQMLAPIALYPDPLLAQILMAATYPLEVVEADRWVHDLSNSELKSDRLTAALEQQPWDPSVKSLVPFHQILRMMDLNLEWTERLGDAFLADQPGVMDSIQRLRQRAQAAGKAWLDAADAGEDHCRRAGDRDRAAKLGESLCSNIRPIQRLRGVAVS